MYYPINLNLKDKKVLIVGGGKVASRKGEILMDLGVDLTIVSPELDGYLRKNIEKFKYINSKFKKEYLKDVFLIIIATPDKELNTYIENEAKSRNILVNNCSNGNSSDFINMSVANIEGIDIAISTKGRCPVLSRYLREDLEDRYEKFNEDYLKKLEELRAILLKKECEDIKTTLKKAIEMEYTELERYISQWEKK